MPVLPVESSEAFATLLANKDGAVHDKQYVFADFYADWCGPCKRIAPRLEEFSETYGDKVLFVKLNIQACEEAAALYSVRALPTFMIFDNGKATSDYQPIMGANADVIEKRLQELTSDQKPSDKISDDF